MSLKSADTPPENCVPNTLLVPMPTDGCPIAARRNAVRYGRSVITESDGSPSSALWRYVITALCPPWPSDGNTAADLPLDGAMMVSAAFVPGGTMTVSGALPSDPSAMWRASSTETGSPCARSAGSAAIRKPALSNTENTSRPLPRATEIAGDDAVTPLTPVAARVTRNVSPVSMTTR